MTRFIKYCFSILLLLFVFSCTNKEDKTYFGGKIINPKSHFVLLYDQNKVIDSLPLNDENKFLGTYTNFKEGFYYFKHGSERQYVYIIPNDSISVRLNTWDFDESLVFDGKGAEKNNVLLDFFLTGEKEDKNYTFYSFYKLQPNNFKSKIDSVLALRTNKINAFQQKNEQLSSNYYNVLNVIAKYPLYIRFEYYPEVHRKINKVAHLPQIESSFFEYRKDANITNDSLMYLGVYRDYVMSRIYSDAFAKGFENSASDDFIIALLNSVTTHIKNESIRNNVMRQIVIRNFVERSTSAISKQVFFTFFKLSSNIEDKKHIQRLLNDLRALKISDHLPNINVIDYNKTKQNIRKLTRHKNSVIYFWNPKYISKRSLAVRMDFLSRQFPKVYFITVKMNENKQHPKHARGFDIKNQFYLNKNSKANAFLTSGLPRTLLVNKKGIVVNAYASIHRAIISYQIADLQKN